MIFITTVIILKLVPTSQSGTHSQAGYLVPSQPTSQSGTLTQPGGIFGANYQLLKAVLTARRDGIFGVNFSKRYSLPGGIFGDNFSKAALTLQTGVMSG